MHTGKRRLRSTRRIARKYFPEDDSENDDVDSDDELRAIGLRSKANLGGAQKSLLVVLQDDLVDAVKCGDELPMSVVIRRRWLKASRDRRCEIELVAHCNSLTVLSVDDKEGNAGDRKTNEVEDDQEYEEMEAFLEVLAIAEREKISVTRERYNTEIVLPESVWHGRGEISHDARLGRWRRSRRYQDENESERRDALVIRRAIRV